MSGGHRPKHTPLLGNVQSIQNLSYQAYLRFKLHKYSKKSL